MKPVDIRKKTVDELKKLVIDLKKELMNLRFQTTAGQNESPARFNQLRKDVARVKTILVEKNASDTVKA